MVWKKSVFAIYDVDFISTATWGCKNTKLIFKHNNDEIRPAIRYGGKIRFWNVAVVAVFVSTTKFFFSFFCIPILGF